MPLHRKRNGRGQKSPAERGFVPYSRNRKGRLRAPLSGFFITKARPETGVAMEECEMLEGRISSRPPSGLPAISPSGGEITPSPRPCVNLQRWKLGEADAAANLPT